MNLKLIIVKNCPACVRAEKKLLKFAKGKKDIHLQIQNLEDYRPRNLAIIPALFINDNLYSYGEIDNTKLSKMLELK